MPSNASVEPPDTTVIDATAKVEGSIKSDNNDGSLAIIVAM